MHVLISGAGIAGLALAQGLLQDGHTVEVVERDPDLSRKEGYYLNMNALGGESLRRLLPPDLFELYLDTARRPYPRQESIVLDPALNELSSRPSMGPPNTGDRRHTGVHRRTLRQILAGRIEQHVRRGAAAVSYEEDADGVTLHLSDGSTARGDLLVAADGIRSPLRNQKLPETTVVPATIMGISLYGRSPFTPQILELTPPELHNGIIIVTNGPDRCLLGSFQPRVPVAEAAAGVEGVELDPVPDYMMVSCSVPASFVVPPSREWTEDTPAAIRDAMLETVADWHPAIPAIVANIDLDSVFAINFSYLEPQEDWAPSRVTVVGDAAHGMLPTLGMGANASLADSAYLADQLAQVERGALSLLDAVGAYEAHMREEAYPVLRLTVDHDKIFGGGALAKGAEPTD